MMESYTAGVADWGQARACRTGQPVELTAIIAGLLLTVGGLVVLGGAATMLLAAGQPIKVISEILGHATSGFTADVYTSVAEELAESAAMAIAAFVPRERHRASMSNQ